MSSSQAHATQKVTPYSIIVNVAQAKKTVFIAMPYDNAFNNLYDVIVQAVNRVGLIPYRTDKVPTDQNFIRDVVTQTQEARVVVAVCSPEPQTQVPNSNVMYELGLAHSLGKATVILTTDPNSLPADLKSLHVLLYHAGREQEIGDRLTILINESLQRVSNNLTDTVSYPNISVAHREHWMLLNPDLWHDFVSILAFAQRVHRLFQDLDTSHIDHLLHEVEDIFLNTYRAKDLRHKQRDCQKNWDHYVRQYESIVDEFWNPQSEVWSSVEYAFKQLQRGAGHNHESLVGKCREFSENIKRQLMTYPHLHSQIAGMAGRGLQTVLRDSATASEMLIHLENLSKTIKGTMTQADALMTNLVNLMH